LEAKYLSDHPRTYINLRSIDKDKSRQRL